MDFCALEKVDPKRFNKKLSFIRYDSVSDGVGGVIVSPVVFLQTWADIIEAKASELRESEEIQHRVIYHIFIRSRAGVSPAMRIDYDGKLLDIEAITYKGERRQYLYIVAVDANSAPVPIAPDPTPPPVGSVAIWDVGGILSYESLVYDEDNGTISDGVNTWATEQYVDAAVAGVLPDGAADGQILSWDEGLGEWVVSDPGSGLPDGTVTGQFATWDNTLGEWVVSPGLLWSGGVLSASGEPFASEQYVDDKILSGLPAGMTWTPGELGLSGPSTGSGTVYKMEPVAGGAAVDALWVTAKWDSVVPTSATFELDAAYGVLRTDLITIKVIPVAGLPTVVSMGNSGRFNFYNRDGSQGSGVFDIGAAGSFEAGANIKFLYRTGNDSVFQGFSGIQFRQQGGGGVDLGRWDSVALEIKTPLKSGGLITVSASALFAINGSVDISVSGGAFGRIIVGDNEEYAEFRSGSGGAVLLSDTTAGFANSDTPGSVCIFYPSAGVLRIKNALASSKTIKYQIHF